MPPKKRHGYLLACLGLALAMAACAAPQRSAPSQDGARLKVIATTTLVGDVVRQVGGDAIDLAVLLPAGADPHSFQPTPQDAALIASADLVFVNGLGLEAFLDRLLQNVGGNARVVAVSDGVETLAGHDEHEDQEGEAEGTDPHVWMDSNNVRVWTRNIAAALSARDPANAGVYQANAQRYDETLQALDTWAQEQIAQIAPADRRMVVDHDAFGYFARRYGLETVGTVVPGYSTMSAPSSQELAQLEDIIRQLGVKAIFVGNTVNPALAEQVARDTGTRLVFLYTGSLGEPGGEAASYVDFIRYNVGAVVEALR